MEIFAIAQHHCEKLLWKLYEERIHCASLMPSYDTVVKQLQLEDRLGIKRM
jgi:hypothetical protein